jgi:hypothetical protein
MKTRFLALVICAQVVAVGSATAQLEAAISFLNISASSEANGMGGTTVAVMREDPLGFVRSPGMIGLQSLTTNVRGSMYAKKSAWLPVWGLSELTFNASGASIGLLLNDVVELPVKIGVGIAYHWVDFDMGTFSVTSTAGPNVLQTVHAEQKASGLTFGVGVDVGIRIAFGYTARFITSDLGAVGPESGGEYAAARVNGSDVGVSILIPGADLIEAMSGTSLEFGPGLRPTFDLSGGAAWNNIGNSVTYVDAAQPDPFPRTGRAGIGIRAAIVAHRWGDWGLLSFLWSREAEDKLLDRRTDGTWTYRSGLGKIGIFENIVGGKLSDDVGLRAGGQVDIGEVLAIRWGRVQRDVFTSGTYETQGYSIRLTGLLKGAAALFEDDVPDVMRFLRDHIDFEYHFAKYQVQDGVYPLDAFSGLTFVLRSWPL